MMARFVETRDREIFDLLFSRYRARVVAHAGRYVGNQQKAEELAQEVFIRVYTAKRYEARASFKAWIYRVATNVCLSEIRRTKEERQMTATPEHPVDTVDPNLGNAPDVVAEAEQLRAKLQQTLAALPDTQRAAFILAHHEGLTYEQIAEALSTTVPAVKSLLHRALTRLRAEAAALTRPTLEEARR